MFGFQVRVDNNNITLVEFRLHTVTPHLEGKNSYRDNRRI